MVTKIWCVEKCTTFWAILYFISRPRPTFPLPPATQPTADGKNCKMSTLSPTKHYTQTNVKTSKSYNNVQNIGRPTVVDLRPKLSPGDPQSGAQPRLQSWESTFLVWGTTALLQKFFLERYTQFGAVCYPHQTPTKRLCKKLGVRPNSGGSVPADPPVVASMPPVAGD